ncbi:hypothetical protein EG856_02345 [Mycoplasmopsis phocirhinis]|uniref:Uncharacterized protein n=1 Tax=Mycoplasmopsis phocirhinis TaxID=142650 RepID=A0A4P6MPT0_9BACT|nr:hypothetical protein [Mycoplasmopsis phocirhinis]QBF34746.1 hypothetical protein EG856_02345 [Mycoplasmopsis phocirhinis]
MKYMIQNKNLTVTLLVLQIFATIMFGFLYIFLAQLLILYPILSIFLILSIFSLWVAIFVIQTILIINTKNIFERVLLVVGIFIIPIAIVACSIIIDKINKQTQENIQN